MFDAQRLGGQPLLTTYDYTCAVQLALDSNEVRLEGTLEEVEERSFPRLRSVAVAEEDISLQVVFSDEAELRRSGKHCQCCEAPQFEHLESLKHNHEPDFHLVEPHNALCI